MAFRKEISAGFIKREEDKVYHATSKQVRRRDGWGYFWEVGHCTYRHDPDDNKYMFYCYDEKGYLTSRVKYLTREEFKKAVLKFYGRHISMVDFHFRGVR